MKLNLTISSLAKIINGKLTAKDNTRVIDGISKDTRALRRGDVYWALKGANFDGHAFIEDAVKKGASLVVCAAGKTQNAGVDTIEVEDTLLALQELAVYQRGRYNIKVAAVTGSNGKSTVKQMMLALTSAAGKTAANSGNLNNHIGAPLSVLEITEDDEYGVFELGASKKGDIDEIARIVRPDVAVITNISPAHLEFFGDLETIYKTKTEIINHLNAGGVLVYNRDDEMLRCLKTDFKGKAVSYGFSKAADLVISQSADNFSFTYKGEEFSVNIKLERHNKLNAAAACGAAIALGVSRDNIERGLKNYQPMPLRLQEENKNGVKFILDYYNANPASMYNAFEILVKNPGPHTAVLGDMSELGKYTQRYHEELARKLIEKGVKNIFLAGPAMKYAYDILSKQAGVMVKYSLYKKDLIPAIKQEAAKGGTVLIKASRALNFEDLYKEI
jgi:UDP-N-acetylmuramoyl-tripeptide--D-alanyl-D-alanine ligase